MATAADNAVRAQGGGLVTNQQLKAMIVTARRAYDAQAKLGLVDEGLGFDAWRRANLHDVVGAEASGSFRLVTQRDYAAVIGYFGELAGEERTAAGDGHDGGGAVATHRTVGHDGGGAVATHRTVDLEREADERRRALWNLDRAEDCLAVKFGGRGGARKYADSLFWNIHKTDRYTATARQVWAVIFTLNNRAAAKRAKTALGARGASGVPLSPPTRSGNFPARFPRV